jgi:hypothetical protein
MTAGNATIDVHGNAANESSIADSSHSTSDYSSRAMDGYARPSADQSFR